MFLAKLFIKDYDRTADPVVRQKYGMLSGLLGILFNLILFVIKITVGMLINSVAVISDAFNNLSDMGSTVISVIGIKLSNKKPDRDHPFGHGRFEYISALIVSFIIMLVGFELFKSSLEKLLHPTPGEDINWLLTGILAISVPIKLFMFYVNHRFGKLISSCTLSATALDCRNDAIATGVVIASTVIDGTHILPFVIDGYMGALVSLLIIYAGFSVAKNTVDILLGKAPDEETVKAVKLLLKETPEIMDIHDLILHDYGPGRVFASVHAEISDDADIIAAHEAIDEAEKRILHETGCEITIHLDPVSKDNEILNAIKTHIGGILPQGFSIHDLRMTNGEEHINIIFDLVAPFEAKPSEIKALIQALKAEICTIDERYSTVIQLDRDFVNTK